MRELLVGVIVGAGWLLGHWVWRSWRREVLRRLDELLAELRSQRRHSSGEEGSGLESPEER